MAVFNQFSQPFVSQLQQPLRFADQGARSVRRIAQTLLTSSPYALRCLLARRLPEPDELRQLFESLGTTYIKFGQLIASSPAIFPSEYVEAFQRLLDQTRTVPFEQIQQQVEQDLGQGIDQVFAWFDTTPLASASIAQVHAARLHSGQEVVVKVQKPGVDTIITVDMNTSYVFMRIVELMLPNVDKDAIAGLVSELYQAMIDECDFRKEVSHLNEFRQFLANNHIQNVVAPRPFTQYSGQKVLVMERLYGRALSDVNRTADIENVPPQLIAEAMNTWFASLTQCDTFHADLHNGNIMLLQDGRIAFIDFGMVGRISNEIWQAVFTLTAGVSTQDYHVVAESMLAIGVTRHAIDVDALAIDIEQLFATLKDSEPMSSDIPLEGVDALINKLADISKHYGIRFPRAFILLLKQFLYFERYMDQMAPDLDMTPWSLVQSQAISSTDVR